MPVVCDNCGSSNRSRAKFCVGCARPLPGFTPSGPGALDAMMAFRPLSEAPERAGARATPVPVLPAETAAFWLKAGCVGLVMLLAFALWCFQVTRRPGAPPLHAELLSMLAPATGPAEAPPAAVVPDTAPAATAAPAAPAPTAATAVAPPATAPPGQRPAPIAALLPAPPPAAAEPPIAGTPIAGTPPYAATRRTAAHAASRPSWSRRERIDASASAAAAGTGTATGMGAATGAGMGMGMGTGTGTAAEPDRGPPIAVGPGPQYSYLRRATPAAGSDGALPLRDPGPPIAPGPGPQYDYSRLPPVRAPAWSSNDPGPPIAVGPGPSVNTLPRGAGPR